jgi:Flp pilus assembly protein TadG
MSKLENIRSFLKQLRNDNSGLAVVEFAVSLPFFMGVTVAGLETANYALSTMKLNQLTIHVADGMARIGTGTTLVARRINETQINDIFAGARKEGSSVDIDGYHAYTDPGSGAVSVRGNAMIIVSSVEPALGFNSATPRYRIRWQRCMGRSTTYTSSFGTPTNATSVTAIGPTGKQVTAPPSGATMFVETRYFFKPVILSGFSNLVEHELRYTAAMVVRDNRDYTQVYASPDTPSRCSWSTTDAPHT